MTKNDIAERIHTKLGLSKKESQGLLELVLDILKDTLEAGDKIKIPGFGKFEIQYKNDRIGRNPQTSETITIPARKILSFKPSTLLKTKINMITS